MMKSITNEHLAQLNALLAEQQHKNNQQAIDLEQALATIEHLDQALNLASTFVPENYMRKSIIPAALALQPCPEVLNKVRADAVADYYDYCYSQGALVSPSDYVQRIEQGEA